ncbi:MAG: single-stranded DNA-binding protein [Chitinophagaceae bacterium]
MEIVGRITKDAVVNQLKDERNVVNFSIAVNDYYKPKNGEGVNVTTYYNCSYWVNSKILHLLTKGRLVEINGRIHVNAYIGADGNAKASLNCHVNTIKLHSDGKQSSKVPKENAGVSVSSNEEPVDDLPF